MKRQARGILLWLGMALLIVLSFNFLARRVQRQNNYSYNAFYSDVENGRIAEAVIHQNTQIPTGHLAVSWKMGKRGICMSMTWDISVRRSTAVRSDIE